MIAVSSFVTVAICTGPLTPVGRAVDDSFRQVHRDGRIPFKDLIPAAAARASAGLGLLHERQSAEIGVQGVDLLRQLRAQVIEVSGELVELGGQGVEAVG